MNAFAQLVTIVGRFDSKTNTIIMLGTAFLISKDGKFATSLHVFNGNFNDVVILQPELTGINDYQDTSINTCKPEVSSVIEADPIKDIAIIQAPLTYQGVVAPLGLLDNVHVGESVYVFGFPHCADGRRVLTMQNAEIGAKVLLESSKIKVKHAVLNFQSRPGQSGSLVFSPRLKNIVGLLVGTYAPKEGVYITVGGVNPGELNQTTHIVSAEYIKEML